MLHYGLNVKHFLLNTYQHITFPLLVNYLLYYQLNVKCLNKDCNHIDNIVFGDAVIHLNYSRKWDCSKSHDDSYSLRNICGETVYRQVFISGQMDNNWKKIMRLINHCPEFKNGSLFIIR